MDKMKLGSNLIKYNGKGESLVDQPHNALGDLQPQGNKEKQRRKSQKGRLGREAKMWNYPWKCPQNHRSRSALIFTTDLSFLSIIK